MLVLPQNFLEIGRTLEFVVEIGIFVGECHYLTCLLGVLHVIFLQIFKVL